MNDLFSMMDKKIAALFLELPAAIANDISGIWSEIKRKLEPSTPLTEFIEKEALEYLNKHVRVDDDDVLRWSGLAVKSSSKQDFIAGANLMLPIIEEKDKIISNLKTVMIAAAEEISEHWDAHCDKEGYGPSSLLRRLEQGIPVEYGYTAGNFKFLQEQIQSLTEEREKKKEKSGRN